MQLFCSGPSSHGWPGACLGRRCRPGKAAERGKVRSMLRRIFSFFHRYRIYAALTVFCVLAESIFELVIPLMMADIVDVGVASGDTDYIFRKGLQMAGCAVLALS